MKEIRLPYEEYRALEELKEALEKDAKANVAFYTYSGGSVNFTANEEKINEILNQLSNEEISRLRDVADWYEELKFEYDRLKKMENEFNEGKEKNRKLRLKILNEKSEYFEEILSLKNEIDRLTAKDSKFIRFLKRLGL